MFLLLLWHWRIWHSEDRASWYILIISQTYFGIELYMFRTGLLSIIRSLELYTHCHLAPHSNLQHTNHLVQLKCFKVFVSSSKDRLLQSKFFQTPVHFKQTRWHSNIKLTTRINQGLQIPLFFTIQKHTMCSLHSSAGPAQDSCVPAAC